ncbi:hypothetical protein B0I72DRAFT_142427 [Yarrowia lipolytica]|jgi:hypothetical protein|uniref:YALI0E23782p n=2 Tax=Yarrowia lipolytica TaxID=4952 RepID=Q6C4T7_YARLI|nr:YALI0E23782p [Yarrowia lipolytica CLIB122]AOW05872.1 hypothetical protein YALI1_E28150g [Yarrowia lipolytica]KAB8285924.1 hypothetical protein BKA91DRAFT_132387 [Yarrowia lipolytica]KAE8172525.1 hypothetical protein BKA90DRAFT_137375 [Yarrowia lipolytica]KAJ8057301.1 hypothetical protein LXG23DRAFT_54002 [Yarrowia lipolytica]QNP99968.1 Hypothetical protein YALI2_E01284g [Yarrowia lipolytica]|eukprot:XP_504325.1 YALI0E23782p [Yarrowia lipolytica CLIB122]
MTGWIYLHQALRLLTPYPQAVLNNKRSSVAGFSLDYGLWAFVGAVCHFVFTLTYINSDLVHRQFVQRYPLAFDMPSASGVIALIDLNESLVWGVCAVQAWYSYRHTQTNAQSWSLECKVIMGLFFGVLVFLLMAVKSHPFAKVPSPPGVGYLGIKFIDVVDWLGIIGDFSVYARYVPQVSCNWTVQSCVGSSFLLIVLDLAGAFFGILDVLGAKKAKPTKERNRNKVVRAVRPSGLFWACWFRFFWDLVLLYQQVKYKGCRPLVKRKYVKPVDVEVMGEEDDSDEGHRLLRSGEVELRDMA